MQRFREVIAFVTDESKPELDEIRSRIMAIHLGRAYFMDRNPEMAYRTLAAVPVQTLEDGDRLILARGALNAPNQLVGLLLGLLRHALLRRGVLDVDDNVGRLVGLPGRGLWR